MKKETKSIHGGKKPNEITGAIITPIDLSTIFAQKEPGEPEFQYGRVHNPTRSVLEKTMAQLESGNFGLMFSSGQAAATTILSVFEKEDHIICSVDVYEGTIQLLEKVFKKFGIEFDIIEMTEENLRKSIRKNTKLVWFETPTNPLLKIIDIKKVSEIAKEHKIKVLVDSSFATPILQEPLKLGADIVLHSLTKFINGHNDVTAGAIVLNDEELYEKLKFLQYTLGAVPSPIDCFLILRGLKTLSIRMKKHGENALKIAKFLENHKKIEKVIFPGLESHTNHKLAKIQMNGFGGVVSFCVKGDLKSTVKFLKNLRLISIAQSYGGAETVVQHPIKMMASSFKSLNLSKEEVEKKGITDNFLRLSLGLEDSNDLINDLKQALEKI